MKRTRRLGEFEQLVLFAVLELQDDDNAYGARVVRTIEERTGERPSVGAVGTTLDRLEARGFLSSCMGDPLPKPGGRRRKLYTLEPEGANLLVRSYDALRNMSQGLDERLRGVASGRSTVS